MLYNSGGMKKIETNTALHVFATVTFLVITAVFLACVSLNGKNGGFSITKEQIAAIEDDGELLETAFAWAENFCPLNENSRSEDFETAPDPVRNVLAKMHLDCGVMNGGFSQFYTKGFNKVAFKFAAAFSAAELDGVAEIVRDAETCFVAIGNNPPARWVTETYFLYFDGNPFSGLDARYRECNASTRAAIASYIRGNIDCFGY